MSASKQNGKFSHSFTQIVSLNYNETPDVMSQSMKRISACLQHVEPDNTTKPIIGNKNIS